MSRTPVLVLAAVLLLPACSLPQKRVQEVDARVAASREKSLSCPAQQRDRCALTSPVLELGHAATREGRHFVALLEYGEQALQLRLHLIRAARETIDVQNFILRKDATGELVLAELLQAARRGVRVRLLLDQMFSFSDAEYLVALTMAHHNFQIRFYNPSFDKAEMARHDWISAVACCFQGFNQRMHNKLQVVDDVVGLVEEGKRDGSIRKDADSQDVAWGLLMFAWAEDVARLVGLDEMITSGASVRVFHALLDDISAESDAKGDGAE